MPKKKREVKKFNPSLNSLRSPLSSRTKILFITGFFLLTISVLWNANKTLQLAFFNPPIKAVKNSHPLPVRIGIGEVGIDLPIEETAINNGAWQVSQNGASHLTVSARPGEKGTIILYSHNNDLRFGPIRWLGKGANINVKTEDGKIYMYKVTKTQLVSPNAMDILTSQTGETLILYTCDGFADLKRFIVIAKPVANPLINNSLIN